jgi:hypothetical protein
MGLSALAGPAAPYLALGMAALSAFGTLKAGEQQKKQSDVEALVAENQAAQEELRTAEQEALRRREARKLVARQKAGFAGAGVTSAGTPLLVMAESLMESEEDVEAIRATGRARAATFRDRGQQIRALGKSRRTASRFQAGSSLLSGLAQFGGSIP